MIGDWTLRGTWETGKIVHLSTSDDRKVSSVKVAKVVLPNKKFLIRSIGQLHPIEIEEVEDDDLDEMIYLRLKKKVSEEISNRKGYSTTPDLKEKEQRLNLQSKEYGRSLKMKKIQEADSLSFITKYQINAFRFIILDISQFSF